MGEGPMKLSRRTVLASGAAAGLAAGVPFRAQAAPMVQALRPAALADVTLGPGPLKDAQAVNRRRLLATDPDRLLHMFRVTAGLPSAAKPLGGWEAPDNELRGHFTGHYMSACAAMAAQGDLELKAKGAVVVAGLAECQRALKTGYVSAFPVEAFARLYQREKVWAPFYTLHKILAGLIDMHSLGGDLQALDVAIRLADWVDAWTAPIPHDHMQKILDTEFGGVGESLWNLQALTGETRYGQAAERFEKRKFLDPLAVDTDALTGLHANTHIPQVIAAARKAEMTGDATSCRIAEFFWTDVTEFRCFATGGTSSGEEWKGERGRLSTELDAYTHECCCTHNMLKLTRHMLSWNGQARAGDYYERALFNGVLGTHNPADGMMMYYVPMAPGFWKMFSAGDDGFWCCDGTGIESFAKLSDSIYFHDQRGVFVNLFANADLEWREKRVRIRQSTLFPEGGRVHLTIETDAPVDFALRVRIPKWAKGSYRVGLNNRRLATPVVRDGWLTVERTWRCGDQLSVDLPMALGFEPMADNPSMQVLCCGPLVMAGGLGTGALPSTFPYAEPTKPREVPEFKSGSFEAPVLNRPSVWAGQGEPPPGRTWIVFRPPANGELLSFRTRGLDQDLTLMPFWRLQGERYAVYWKTTG
ncbi:MAG: glycoside hydrolase family 127 protein [Proteobacteria bacterium]|nr:glycoside hydrolase family 127 protein [Pseudomonadota bacterium]